MAITRIPIRLAILRSITAALKEVNPDNGYEFDLRDDDLGRERVVRGDLIIGDDEPLPMVSIMEPPMAVTAISTVRQPDNPKRVGEWDLIIQGWAKKGKRKNGVITPADDRNPMDVGYQLMHEVRHRLAQEKKKARNGVTNFFGFPAERISNMTIGDPVVRPNEHVSEQAVFYLVLTLQITEDMAAPLG